MHTRLHKQNLKQGIESFNNIKLNAEDSKPVMNTKSPGEKIKGHIFNKLNIHDKSSINPSAMTWINKPGDMFEQEAEHIAGKIMKTPENVMTHTYNDGGQSHEGKKGGYEHQNLKKGNYLSAAHTDILAPRIVNEVLRSPGQPLDRVTRAFMEPRFGYDFTQVRIHTDPKAIASAEVVNARAFTVGNDIVFGAGQYGQEKNGRQLIAHELTHVCQNRNISGPRQIQRYEGPEHQDLGNKNLEELFDFVQTEEGAKWAQEKGIDPVKLVKDMNLDPVYKNKKIKVRSDLELTPGDIIALMGDFYATWQELKAAPKKEIEDILNIMQKERLGKTKNANDEYEKVTKGRYTKLARINTKHFAPVNRDAWKKMHLEALSKADTAGKNNDEEAYQEALLIDAAGGHFLTDSFASGHLFDSSKVLVAITSYIKNNPLRTENPEMQTVVGGLDMGGLAASLVLKNIHDRMNREGFNIRNNKGMTWKSFGDNYLKNAQETRRIASYAVFISRQQVTSAKKGEQVNVNEVLDLLPNDKTIEQATDQAYGYIPAAVRELTPLIHRNVGMLGTLRLPIYLGGPVLPFIGKSIIGTISDPARPRTLEDYDRRKSTDSSTPYPTPPLLKWEF